MLCPRCNNQLEEDAAYCGVCGALIKPKLSGETVLEASDSIVSSSPAVIAPTRYVTPQLPAQQFQPTMMDLQQKLSSEQSADQRSMRDTPLPNMPPPTREPRKTPKFFGVLAILTIIVLIVGGLYWYRTTTPRGQTSTPATAVVANGQVSFLDSQDNALGTTNALKITATGLPNPPEGSRYDVWLMNTLSEDILPLGSLSKSDPTTFALAYPNDSSPSQTTNLIGAGNKVQITQEQGRVTVPVGQVMLSATFPPLAFVHIRHLLFKFPTTPANIGLLTGLVNETQKVNSLALLLQGNATSKTASVTCIAQSMVNIIEGKDGARFRPLAANCASLGIGPAVTGDGFGILGNGYVATAAKHAALAASQPDTTDGIRQSAKDIEASTASVKTMMTNINNDLAQLLADPSTTANLVADIVSLSNRAYHGFDQNGNGKIEPVVGEAGALTAYTSGQRMAELSLA